MTAHNPADAETDALAASLDEHRHVSSTDRLVEVPAHGLDVMQRSGKSLAMSVRLPALVSWAVHGGLRPFGLPHLLQWSVRPPGW